MTVERRQAVHLLKVEALALTVYILPSCLPARLSAKTSLLCPVATFVYGLRVLFSNAPNNSAARRAANGSTGGADGTSAGEGRIKCITEKRALQVEVGFKKLGKNALQLARALSKISDDCMVWHTAHVEGWGGGCIRCRRWQGWCGLCWQQSLSQAHLLKPCCRCACLFDAVMPTSVL